MQIDWDKAIEEILADRLACPRCESFTERIVAGYTREPWGSEYAPRCQFCNRSDDCDARKLVVLCSQCAAEMGLRARPIDQEQLMVMLLNDCRRDLEECLDYLLEYWQDDLDVPAEEAEKKLEEYAPDVFAEEYEARRRLEEEYLTYHRWFRDHHVRVPDPGWRSEFAEEVVSLGYTTRLGD